MRQQKQAVPTQDRALAWAWWASQSLCLPQQACHTAVGQAAVRQQPQHALEHYAAQMQPLFQSLADNTQADHSVCVCVWLLLLLLAVLSAAAAAEAAGCPPHDANSSSSRH